MIAFFKTLRRAVRPVGISEEVNIGTKELDQGMIFCEEKLTSNGLNNYCSNNFYENVSYGKIDNPS